MIIVNNDYIIKYDTCANIPPANLQITSCSSFGRSNASFVEYKYAYQIILCTLTTLASGHLVGMGELSWMRTSFDVSGGVTPFRVIE